MNKNIYNEVLDKIIYLYEGYSKEHRACTQPFHLDMEEQRTNTGKFAKAIDKITPDIVDLMTPAEVIL